jgi:hypothetical protein
MSCSTLLKVYRTKCTWDLELPNSHGTWPFVADYLSQKYAGSKPFGYTREDLEVADRLVFDRKGEMSERVAWFLCWDRSLIRREHVPLCAKALRVFYLDTLTFRPDSYVNHWPTIAGWFATVKLDRRCLGLALNTTSCADVWDAYPKLYSSDEPIQHTSDLLFGEVR